MRPPTACVACRNRRRKCEVTTPGAPCVYCKNRDVLCSFAASPTANGLWTQSPTSPKNPEVELVRCQSISTQLPPRPLCIQLVELYFQYIHDTFHTLFHRPSVIQDVIDGTFPNVTLFAMISLSARYVSSLSNQGDTILPLEFFYSHQMIIRTLSKDFSF